MAPTLVRKEDAPRFEVHGAQVVGYASPSRGSPGLSAWRVSLDPGAQSPLHALEGDEVFLALRGEAEFRFAGETVRVRAGDGLTVPAGTTFAIATVGDGSFEAVACVQAGTRASVGGGAPFLPPWAS